MAEPTAPDARRLTVVICSYNGGAGLHRVFDALARQTIVGSLDVVLVDDGSTDDTASVGQERGARVIMHPSNLGIGAARNTGLAAATTPVIAYVDDDCEPDPCWAATLLAGFEERDVVGVSGPVITGGAQGYVTEYLTRHSPALPLELELAVRSDIAYRFGRYLARNWQREQPAGRRRVFSFTGANMAFRTAALREIKGFDDSMTFGPEDIDVCMRLRAAFGDGCLLFDPAAAVLHHFDPGLVNLLLKRSAYGRGHARMLAKYPQMRPTVFPLPLAFLGLMAIAVKRPKVAWAAFALPHVFHPSGLRGVLHGAPRTLLDPYVAMLQEGAFNLGVLDGLRRSRP